MEYRIIAFGDIHGHHKAAITAVQLAKNQNAQAIFLGDYVDRGPDSIKTLQILIKAKKENPGYIFLRGNHDQMLLDLINGHQLPNTEFDVLCGKSSNHQATLVFQKWKILSKINQKDIATFIENSLLYYETDKWIFVHAPLKGGKTVISEKTIDELLWNYELNPSWQGKQFIHGHVVIDAPKWSDHGYNINTGCGFGGYLTGTLIEMPFNGKIKNYNLINFSITETGILKLAL